MKPVNPNISFSKMEEDILRFWEQERIFERSLEPNLPTTLGPDSASKPRPDYVFYDGPPFATGLPHYGHLLAGTIKDVIGRFFTMKGYRVDRRFGWDCHGVPVEFEIQKTLDLHGAKAIKEYGVRRFNEECRKIVLRYTKEWEAFVIRSGRWVDFSRQYRTMDLEYMESIWWVLRRLWDRGLIYEGVKCVPYSWAINTPLSNFEANLNYKNVQDPQIAVKFPLIDQGLAQRFGVAVPSDYRFVAYVWTTTPWTLPSNMALAVQPNITYSIVVNPAAKEVVLIASSLRPGYFQIEQTNGVQKVNGPSIAAAAEKPYLAGEIPGTGLIGLEYLPLFGYFEKHRRDNAFRIYPGEFVSETEGTGIVHCASFGAEDLELFLANNIPVVDPVDEDGRFTDEVPDFAGLNVKDADPKIIQSLKDRQLLVFHKTIDHSYPFCWRTETPLIYKSISTWFVKVEQFKDELMQINSLIHWVPEHIKDGRFGKWLENARDWAISRNRFWGTPIPIWRCSACQHAICIGSVAELEELTGAKVSDLHSHFIDHLTVRCPKCRQEMRRIPEVLDCWFESGSMPYAQSHYPFENKTAFEEQFPADFIAEGLDQTRGWFYTLLVLSTALFGRPAFRNVIVNGIVLAEDGKKMSKSLKNYPPPDSVMDEFGADAMRLYLLSSAATRAEDLRFSKSGVREVVRQTLLPLWNAYNFFVTYAEVDNWSPDHIPEERSPNLLDRWILSKVCSLISGVDNALSTYHLYAAAPPILDFVDQLTNWYIRLNRRRFWAGDSPEEVADKRHAYATLHRTLVSFARVLAPLAPFVSEEIFRNLTEGLKDFTAESVHLAPFPTLAELKDLEIDQSLERAMELFEEVILLGRTLRNDHELKVRQPLAQLTVVHPDQEMLTKLKMLDAYIRDELNIKQVEYSSDEEKIVSLKARLNTQLLGKVLGPKLGSAGMKKLREQVESLPTAEIRRIEQGETLKFEGVELGANDILIERITKPGVKASASSGQITVVLDTNLTQELKIEGFAREFVNRVQRIRKELGLDVSDRILLSYLSACPLLQTALKEHGSYVMRETLALEIKELTKEENPASQENSLYHSVADEIGGKALIIGVMRYQA